VKTSTLGVGADVSLTLATNVTVASAGGLITTAGDVDVLAARDASVAGSSDPTYSTSAVATPGLVGASTVVPAIAFAMSVDTTAALLLAAVPASTTAGIGAVGAPVGNVEVWASALASTTSSAGPGSAAAPAETVGGPLAMTFAFDTTVALSLARVWASSVSVTAKGENSSSAHALAGANGVSAGSGTVDGLFGGLVSQLTPLAVGTSSSNSDLPTLASLVPVALPSGAGVPSLVPSLPASVPPSVESPNALGAPVELPVAASMALNVAVSTTAAAVPLGLVDVTGAGGLGVLAEGYSVPAAVADSSVPVGSGSAATAVGVDVAFVTLSALLGGSVVVGASGGPVVVQTLILVAPGQSAAVVAPVADAFSGGACAAGGCLGNVVGAFALSLYTEDSTG
jgi:hypothetical protein